MLCLPLGHPGLGFRFVSAIKSDGRLKKPVIAGRKSRNPTGVMEGDEAAAAAATAEPEPSQRPLVLLLRPLYPPFEESLSKKFRFLKPWEGEPITPRPLFLAAHADSIRVVLCSGMTPFGAELIASLPRLECVVTTSAGVNHIDLPECRRKGIRVANSGDAFSEDAADYAVALLIDVLHGLSAADRRARSGGLWPVEREYSLGPKLGGKKVGIVGLGNIGSEIAKRLEAFGCIISYNSRNRKPSVPYPYFSDVCTLAAESDVLVLSCALTSETRHMINKNVLSALGKHGIVINIGRGPLIDEKELVRCLMEGEIGGAGLDVFENEPSVPKELFLMDNVVLSPHRAIFTIESFSNLLQIITGNLEAFFSNKPLLSPVID